MCFQHRVRKIIIIIIIIIIHHIQLNEISHSSEPSLY